MGRTVITPIQKRFDDIDIFHHVNNVHQQQYFDLGKGDYFQSLLGHDVVSGQLRLVTASTHTDYLGQIRYEDDLVVSTTVGKIGNKSLTLLQRLVCRTEQGEDIRSESRSVMVAFDFEKQLSVEIPLVWRQALER